MRKTFSVLVSLLITAGLSNGLFAQWAQNKNAREDAKFARVLQGSEDVIIDGVEDPVWAMADSVVVGYGQTGYLPSSGFNLQKGQLLPGDSANAVCKFLFKNPYLYLLYKVVDQSVGGRDWEQSDAIIMAFKRYPTVHSWIQNWDYRVEHFYTWLWIWDTTAVTVGEQPWFRGSGEVGGGRQWKRTEAQKERWTAYTNVIGGTSNDSIADEGWISEHRIRIDSLGFDVNGDVLPFSFSIFDADRFLDSTATNDAHNKAWWGNEWNENWWYAAIFIDPAVTTASPAGLIPPVDYTIPHIRSTDNITIDGDISEWIADNTLHFRAKYGDDAAFDSIRGTGAWASGYHQNNWNNNPTVVDGPEVDYWVTYDDANLYVAAQVADQIVTVPGEGSRKDGISFTAASRKYTLGAPILPSKIFTINIDSSGNAQAGDDLVGMADTGGVEFSLQLGDLTNVNDISEVDNGYTAELKIPFTSLAYPLDLGDSVVFIGGRVNDIDIFDDTASNYYAKAWWFVTLLEDGGPANQKSPAWVVLGPANPGVGVNDEIAVPTSIMLYKNYPNPFNPTTTIKYSTNVIADVTLSVYNILGQVVSVMKKTNVPAGFDEFKFDAGGLSSGVYFYQLDVKNLSSTNVFSSKVMKMVLLK
ncbi:MAG TPA: T9SS type A sorting domain-containing protein [Ignavibacteriaceae bacterium]|nr:T9SS type A sorting domain-containing protein [Ignavibacteriaceae bacterium]